MARSVCGAYREREGGAASRRDWTVSWPPCLRQCVERFVRPSPAPPPDACDTGTKGSKIRADNRAESGAGVRHREGDLFAAPRGGDCDRPTGCRRAGRVGDQIGDHPLDLAAVGIDVRKVGWGVEIETNAARFHLKAKRVHRSGNERGRTGRREHRRDGARFDLRQIEEFAHQAIEPRRSSRHTSELLLTLPSGPAVPSSSRWIPICTLVSGVRSSWEAAAMNSDLSRLISPGA